MNTLKRLLLILLTAGTTLFAGFTNIDCTNEGNLTVLRITEGDCRGMESFWDATGQGAGWRDTIGWDELPLRSVTEWTGYIKLHDDNRSVKLFYVQNNNVSGNIENVRYDLFTELWGIGVNDNRITGSLPKNLPTSLKYIRAYKNQFTGTIPENYGNLTQLVFIKIYDNNLSGPLPDLSALTELKDFELYHNRFTFADIEPQMGWIEKISGADYTSQGNINTLEDGSDYQAGYCYHYFIDESDHIVYFDKTLRIQPRVPINPSNNDRYKWFKDSSELVDHDGNRIYIKENATLEDEGEYYYEANNTIVTRDYDPIKTHMLLCGSRFGNGIRAIHDHTPKVSNNTPPHTATEGETYTYTSNISDADKDELNVTAGILPSWLSLTSDASSFTLTGTPDDGSAGDYDINIIVTDGKIPVHISYTLHVNPSGDSLPNGFTETNGVYSHDSTHNSITGAANLAIVNNGLELTEACSGTVGAFAELDSDGKLLTGYQNCSTHARTQTLTTPYPGNAHASLLSDSILVELPLTQDITIGEN